MRKWLVVILLLFICLNTGYSQVTTKGSSKILFHGLVLDAITQTPLSNSHISINRSLFSISDLEGKFAFYVSRNDTVTFTRLGYKPAVMIVSDTLTGKEYIAGVYMHTDTLTIGEVIIIPRFSNLRSVLMNPRSEISPEEENARYNLEISAYQGRITQNKLGDPQSNYEILRQKQRINAYEKGGIPSDKIIGISPFLILPAAYLLIHGLPEKPAPFKPQLTDQEVRQIHEKYLKNWQR